VTSLVYLDTSVLAKCYLQETGTAETRALLHSAQALAASSLSRVEMASALSKAVRIRMLSHTEAQSAWESFSSDWPALIRLPVFGLTLEKASALAWAHGLRGYDAVHLATATLWQENMGVPVTFATFDRQLWVVGRNVGLSVWPESLGAQP
jgi:uncharacterized protein